MYHVATERGKKPRWNWRNFGILIVTILTVLAVQEAHSMPPKEFRPRTSILDAYEYEESREWQPINERPSRNATSRRLSGRDEKRNLSRSKIPSRHGDINFPEDMNEQNFIPVVMPACQGKFFCEDTPAYPLEHVRQLISKTENLKMLAGVDELPVNVPTRVGGVDGDDALCGSMSRVVFPKLAPTNADNQWLFIVQDEANGYRQGVKVENCEDGAESGACRIIEGAIPGYKTSCKQKYVSRVLAAVSKNGTGITDKFAMPSSCCCHIEFIGGDGILSRMGGSVGKNQTPVPVKSGPSKK